MLNAITQFGIMLSVDILNVVAPKDSRFKLSPNDTLLQLYYNFTREIEKISNMFTKVKVLFIN
jgi:hypothetical protein